MKATRVKPTRVGTARAALALLLAGSLAGCLTVPTSGSVRNAGSGQPGSVAGAAKVRTDPAPPMRGATPLQIVNGFYNAMVDESGETGKKFLVAGAWERPPSVVDVITRATRPELVGSRSRDERVFEVGYTRVGQILADGQFVAMEDTPTDQLLLRQEIVDGAPEWRIATPPTALVMSVSDFLTVYQAVTLYHPYNKPGEVLGGHSVPDRRFFSGSRAAVIDRIAQEYANGPSRFVAIDPLVQRMLPEGTTGKFVEAASPIDVAMKFTAPAPVDIKQRNALTYALHETLAAAFPSATTLTLDIDGQVTERSLLAEDVTPSVRGIDAAWFVDDKGALRRWTEAANAGQPARGTVFDVRKMDLKTVSLSSSESLAAGVSKGASKDLLLVDKDGKTETVEINASALSTPAWNADNTGVWLAGEINGVRSGWFVPLELGSTPQAGNIAGTPRPVRVDVKLPKGRLTSLRPAPDGIRMSVTVERQKSLSELYVGRLDRRSELTVNSFRRVGPLPVRRDDEVPTFDVRGAMWTSPEQLTLVAKSDRGSYQLWDAALDGSSVEPRQTNGLAIDEKTTIAASENAAVLALDGESAVWQLELGTLQWLQPRAGGKDARQPKVRLILYAG